MTLSNPPYLTILLPSPCRCVEGWVRRRRQAEGGVPLVCGQDEASTRHGRGGPRGERSVSYVSSHNKCCCHMVLPFDGCRTVRHNLLHLCYLICTRACCIHCMFDTDQLFTSPTHSPTNCSLACKHIHIHTHTGLLGRRRMPTAGRCGCHTPWSTGW
jgi:hypothetical protein